MMTKAILQALLLFLSLNMLHAGEPIFTHYNSQDGLPSDMVYDIYRDSHGMLWFGTDNGIAKYNGVNFKVYSTHHGLSDNEIFFFKEDHNRRIWMSTYNGTLCYYHDGTIYNAEKVDFLKIPIKPTDTKFITVHKDSSVSISFLNCNFFLNIKDTTLRILQVGRLGISHIQTINKHHANLYEIITEKNKILIDSNARAIDIFPLKHNRQYYISYVQDSVHLFDQYGMYNTNEELVYRFKEPIQNRIIRIYQHNGVLLVGTDNGLIIDGKQYLPGEKISSITQDINGNYWIGTLGNGVYKLSENFEQYSVQKNAYNGIVKYVHRSDKRIVFSTTENELYEINDQCKLLLKTDKPAGDDIHYINDEFFYTYSGHAILKIAHNPTAKSVLEKYISNQPSYTLKAMILNDSDGYFHYANSVLYARIHGNKISANKLLTGANTRVFWMNKDDEDKIWFTTGELYKASGAFATRQTQFDDIAFQWFRFYGHSLVGVTQDNKLIYAENIYNKQAPYYIIKDNCTWNTAFRIDDHHILLATNDFYRLLSMGPYGKAKDGFSIHVLDNEFLPLAAEYVTTRDSNVYAMKNGHIYSISIKALLSAIKPPEISDVIFTTNKRRYNPKEPIDISHTEAHNILVNFGVLSFSSKKLYYQYSISKNNKDEWNIINNPELNLYLSGFGNFEIKLRAITQSGISSKVYILNVEVSKPYYFRWWFIVSASILGIIIVFTTVRYRIHYLLCKKDKEHQMHLKVIKSEYKALNALMNPHFVFNSLTNIQGFINTGNKSSANFYLDLLSRLMRQNMQNVSKEIIVLDEELELIKQYLLLERMRHNDSFVYHMDIDARLDSANIFIPPLLIQPLIENAIKHGLLPDSSNDNKLWLRIYISHHDLIVEVEDNGVGLHIMPGNNVNPHNSFALKNIYSRVSQLNELHNDAIKLEIQSKAGSGTKVIVTINVEKLTPAVHYRS